VFSRNLKVTLIEEQVAWGDKAANIAQLRRNLQNMPDDTDLVILPELFTTGFITDDPEQMAQLAEWNSGETLQTLRTLAREYRIGIIGSFLANTAAQLFNRAFFIEPNGEDTFYDKHHLFRLGGENETFKQGQGAAPIIRFRGFNIKIIVCYDLRFPVFCRNVDNNYDVLVCVANWPKSREKAWRTLLAARAMENECYVCGVNRCGADPHGVDYGEGSSLVVDFRGKVIAQRMTGPIISTDLSPALLAQFREAFPAWKDADPFTLTI